MPASPKKQKPPRKQVNIGFDPADYERIQAAAAAEELTPTEFIRDARPRLPGPARRHSNAA